MYLLVSSDAVPILGIVIALLYQADAVFAHALSGMFSFDVPVSRVAGIVFTFAYALLAAYCGIRYLGKGTISAQSKDLRKLEPMIANTILVLISVVYVLFCITRFFPCFSEKCSFRWLHVCQICKRGIFPVVICVHD